MIIIILLFILYYSLISAQRSAGYVMEVFGNYLALYKVQNELEKIAMICKSYIYDHVVTGAPRFIFMCQTGSAAAVKFTRLKRDCAVNLLSPSLLDNAEDQRKFVSAFEEQMVAFRRECLPYMHGDNQLDFHVEFGSIYANQTPFFGALTVGNVEKMLEGAADPQRKAAQARNRGSPRQLSHKFISLSTPSDLWNSSFPGLTHESTSEVYILEVKAGKNTIRFAFNSNMEFTGLKIPPVTWLCADVKTPRPTESRSRDVDIRLSVSSPRELRNEAKRKVVESPVYEKYVKGNVIRKNPTSGTLELDRSVFRKILYVRHEKTRSYKVPDLPIPLQLHACVVDKYKVQNNHVLTNPAHSVEVQLFTSFAGNDATNAPAVAEHMWSAAKQLKLFMK